MSTETTRLIRGGEKGGYGGGGEGEIIHLLLQCHHSCVKMGSGKNHFNVSLIVRDKVTRQCPQTTTILKRKETKAESNRGPYAYQPNCLTTRPNQLTAHFPCSIAEWYMSNFTKPLKHFCFCLLILFSLKKKKNV